MGDDDRGARRPAPPPEPGPEPLTQPLDAWDPRFEGSEEARSLPRRRDLVASMGPGTSQLDNRVRILRIAVRVLFAAMIVAIAAVFWIGLHPGDGRQVVGPEPAVRAAVAERPRRVCYQDSLPCAWLTVVDGKLIALSTSGPLAEEYGRLGVGWCPSSQRFMATTTTSVYDRLGRVVTGPAPRGLDYVGVDVTADGTVVVDFSRLTTNLQAHARYEVLPAEGPPCTQLGFDREADLRLAPGSAGAPR